MNKYEEFEDVIFITVLCLTTFYLTKGLIV
jgi:hypothetical protein